MIQIRLRHRKGDKLDEQSSIDEFFHGKRLSSKQQGIVLLGFSHSELRPIVDILRLEGCHYFHEPLRYSPYAKSDIREIQKYIVELISCRFKYIYRVFSISPKFERFFEALSKEKSENLSGGAISERRSCSEKQCRVVAQSFDEYFGSLADIRWLKFVQNGLGASLRALIIVRDPRVLLLQKYKDQKTDILEYADEIVKYCDAMVDNWSRLYDLTQEKLSKSIKIVKYESLQLDYENEVKQILGFLKLDSAKFDPFPIFEDSLTLSLRRNIYKAYNAVQNDCSQFLKMYQYTHFLFEDFIESLEYLTISVSHE